MSVMLVEFDSKITDACLSECSAADARSVSQESVQMFRVGGSASGKFEISIGPQGFLGRLIQVDMLQDSNDAGRSISVGLTVSKGWGLMETVSEPCSSADSEEPMGWRRGCAVRSWRDCVWVPVPILYGFVVPQSTALIFALVAPNFMEICLSALPDWVLQQAPLAESGFGTVI
jgi:hypothetical protein